MAVEAVTFDLGGVLIDWNPRHLYRTVFADENEMERFLGSVCTLEWHYQHDLGRSMSVTLPEQAERFPEYRAQIMLWANQDAMVGDAVPEVVDVLRRLRARSVPCFAITNWPSESFRSVRDRFDFLDWFAGIVVSGEEGIVKPDPRVFRLLLDRYGLEAGTTLFIDDSPGHIGVAAELGFVTHLFQGVDELTTALSDLDLL
jgi:2-haloacid dehalogenase